MFGEQGKNREASESPLTTSCFPGFEADGYWIFGMVGQRIEIAIWIFGHCMFSYCIVSACSATALHFVLITSIPTNLGRYVRVPGEAHRRSKSPHLRERVGHQLFARFHIVCSCTHPLILLLNISFTVHSWQACKQQDLA